MKNYFDMLGVPATATPEQITTQYECLTHLYHPDHFANPVEKMYAKRKCIALTAAYHTLLGIDSEFTRQPEDTFIYQSTWDRLEITGRLPASEFSSSFWVYRLLGLVPLFRGAGRIE